MPYNSVHNFRKFQINFLNVKSVQKPQFIDQGTGHMKISKLVQISYPHYKRKIIMGPGHFEKKYRKVQTFLFFFFEMLADHYYYFKL
jgi:hypothetical protein